MNLSPFKAKTFERFGEHFVTEHKTVDLTSMYFLHTGVDTLKQLFSCNLRSSVLQQIERHYEIFSTDLINIDGYDFLLSKGTKKGGYQYTLKNLEAGFVVLLKSFYTEADQNGSHVKIEVTPQKIIESDPKQLTEEIRSLAYVFATNVKDKGIAAHLCTDILGYTPPPDFEHRLQTSSRRQFRVNGMSHAEWNLNEIAVIHGMTETYTFGQSSAIQMCLYDKTQEARKNDKLHFWESIWQKVVKGADSKEDFLTPAYLEGDTVRRLEFRFHHSVIEDFERFIQQDSPGTEIKNYEQLHHHLSGLWNYALNNFRLMDEKGYVDPVWQALSEDIVFFNIDAPFLYKRAYKKPSSDVNHRHVAHALGNYIKIQSRKNLKPAYVTKKILDWGMESDLCSYFRLLEFGEIDELHSVLLAFVTDRMLHHRLNGVGV